MGRRNAICSVYGFTSFEWHIHASISPYSSHHPSTYLLLHGYCCIDTGTGISFIFLSLGQPVYLFVRNTKKSCHGSIFDRKHTPSAVFWERNMRTERQVCSFTWTELLQWRCDYKVEMEGWAASPKTAKVWLCVCTLVYRSIPLGSIWTYCITSSSLPCFV